jgi:hypothetical protein
MNGKCKGFKTNDGEKKMYKATFFPSSRKMSENGAGWEANNLNSLAGKASNNSWM